MLYKQSKIPYFMYHLFSTVYSALFDFFSIPEEMTIQWLYFAGFDQKVISMYPFLQLMKIYSIHKNTMNQLLYIIVIIHQNASINVVGKCLKISYCCVFLNNLIWKIKVINFIQMQFKYAYHIYANKFLKKINIYILCLVLAGIF